MKKILTPLCMLIYIFPAPAQDLDLHGNPTLRPPYEAPAPPSSALKGAGGPPVILHVIPSQVSYTEDIAWDGKYLWVEGYNTNTLYQLSPVDGSIVKTIPSNVMRPYGLAFGDNSLWVADTDNHLIQQVDTSNGNVLSSFPTPAVFGGSYPTGLAWDGTQLWHNDAMATGGGPNDSTYYISTAGQVLQHYHGFGTYITGLAWDGQYLWSNDNPSQLIYKIDPVTFTALGVISAPGGAYPNGLAFDGQYLWVANNTTDSIYKIDTASVTGIGDKFETTGFTTFPNPVSQTLTIEIPPSALGSDYIISDALGRRVLEGRCLSTYSPVDMSDQPPGWYICRLAGINAPAVFLKLRE